VAHGSIAVAEPAAEPELWLTYQEAAERLDWRLWKLKSRARREGWPVRERNRGGNLVRIPAELTAESRQSSDIANGHAKAEPEAELLELVAELRERAARAEGELAAELRHSLGLAEALARSDTRAERLEAALAEARKGWLERLLEALRRR
jgi:hypothetical protein